MECGILSWYSSSLPESIDMHVEERIGWLLYKLSLGVNVSVNGGFSMLPCDELSTC